MPLSAGNVVLILVNNLSVSCVPHFMSHNHGAFLKCQRFTEAQMLAIDPNLNLSFQLPFFDSNLKLTVLLYFTIIS